MPPLAWASLAFMLFATAAGTVFAATRGLDTWRALRSLQGALDPVLVDVNRGVAAMESRAAAVPAGFERLEQATARLQASIAVARLIADAAQDVRSWLRVLNLLRR
jgi:hypothetical protein